MDEQVKVFFKQFHEYSHSHGTAEGNVQNVGSNLLASNGGSVVVIKNWVKSLMTRMNFVKNGQIQKPKFLMRSIKSSHGIPKELVIDWDHTGIDYVPVSNWTMEAEGSKRVAVTCRNR